MKKVTIEDVDTYMGPAAEKRPLGTALGTTDMAVNYYELEPGDSFAFGYHSHGNQEEVFYVQSGVATFETEEGAVDVGAGEARVPAPPARFEVAGQGPATLFAPGEFQRGVNESDDDVVALALGAPRESGELEMLRECPDCGERTENTIEMADGREALVTLCGDCESVTGRFE